MTRRLTLLDGVAIGINGIVGSGIYLLPGRLYGLAGAASIASFVLAGLLCFLVALCFAEAAGMHDRSGGPYLYARSAFGEPLGFAVGWVCAFTGVLAFASVARGLFEQAALFVPALTPGRQAIAAVAFIGALGVANLRGVRVGAAISDAVSFLKLVPLLALGAFGLFAIRPGAFAAGPAPTAGGVAAAALVAVFACSGFEFIPVPAGEAAAPRRDAPRAILGTLAGATALYALLQAVVIGTHPDLAGSARPLSEAAGAAFGPIGERALALGAVVSTAGFCAGSALVAPRYLTPLAEDGLLPAFLARRSAAGTPAAAIAATCLGAAALAAAYDFRRLVDLTAVVLFLQYLPTCAAVLVLRVRRPDLPRTVRVPSAVPVLAMGFSVALLVFAQNVAAQLAFVAKVLAAGAVVYVAMRRWTRRSDPRGNLPG